MEVQEAVQLIHRQRGRLAGVTDQSFRAWKSRTLEIVERIFGEESRQAREFAKVKVKLAWFKQQKAADIPGFDRTKLVDKGEAAAFLTALIEELNEDGLPERVGNDRPALSAMDFLERVFNRFQKVERQLRRRREGRETLEVKDEYDVSGRTAAGREGRICTVVL